MILVINEWIFHDLLGENGPQRFRQTAEFVLKLDKSPDIVVMPIEERWRIKANQLWRMANPIEREIGRLLLNLFVDSNRCIRLEPEDIPEKPRNAHSWAPSEDVYLIEAYLAAGADLLVTTDETLNRAISEHRQFTSRLRDEFLSTYTSDSLYI